MMNFSLQAGIILTSTLVTILSPEVRAADSTWTGATSTDWNTISNWDIDPTSNNLNVNWYGGPPNGNIPVISASQTLAPGPDVKIGEFGGTGQVNHTAGSATWTTVVLGWAGGTGIYNLADTTTSGGVLTGYGTGSGSVSVDGLILGSFFGTDGGTEAFNVNTSGSLNATFDMGIGKGDGTATMNVDQGTLTAGGSIIVGFNASASGTATGNLNIGDGSVSSAFRIYLGNGTGDGEANVGVVNLSGGQMACNGVNFWDGGVSIASATPNRNGGTGTFNLNGGVLTTRYVFSENRVNDNGTPEDPLDDVTYFAGSSTFNFNGGTLKPIQDQPNFWDAFMQNLTRANVRNGGAIIDTNGFSVRFNQALVHSDIDGDNTVDGGLVKNGVGTLEIAGINTYTGNTTVNQGTLASTTATFDDSSDVTVVSGAILNLNHGDIDIIGKLFVNGVQLASGLYRSSESSDPGTVIAGLTGTGKLQVTTGPGAGGYSTWAATNVGGAPPSEDTDLDGVSNGVEYFMNAPAGFTANPGPNSINSVTWTNGGNIPASAYGTEYVVQISTDLVIWTDVLSGNLAGNTNGPGGAVSYTITGAGKQFARLKVTPN